MGWIRLINRVGTWILIAIPVLWSGLGNLREQFGTGVAKRWDSWSDVFMGWGFWLVGAVIWVVIVRGVTGWIDRKLGPTRS